MHKRLHSLQKCVLIYASVINPPIWLKARQEQKGSILVHPGTKKIWSLAEAIAKGAIFSRNPSEIERERGWGKRNEPFGSARWWCRPPAAPRRRRPPPAWPSAAASRRGGFFFFFFLPQFLGRGWIWWVLCAFRGFSSRFSLVWFVFRKKITWERGGGKITNLPLLVDNENRFSPTSVCSCVFSSLTFDCSYYLK